MPRTYRSLARLPEFTPFFAATALRAGASTVGGLALAVLVYDRTRSPLLSALSMFGPSFTQMLGATLLLSAADRLEPRAALGRLAALTALGTALLALPGLPLGVVFAVPPCCSRRASPIPSRAASGTGCSPRSCRPTGTCSAGHC